MTQFIVTVTGMRDWPNKQQVWDVLDELLEAHYRRHGFNPLLWCEALRDGFTVRHGKSGNVDIAANDWGIDRKVTIERFQADWGLPGGGTDYSAGPRRNRVMAAAQPPADLGLAFWDGTMRKKAGQNREYSGTLDCMKALLAQGVPLRVEPLRK